LTGKHYPNMGGKNIPAIDIQVSGVRIQG